MTSGKKTDFRRRCEVDLSLVEILAYADIIVRTERPVREKPLKI
jgi:hypothetical protein